MSLSVALFMLALGLNLLDVFRWARPLQPSMPGFISKRALGTTGMTHTFTPALVGGATFFLPCGFTQAMQLYAVSTGSPVSGALTMFFFALGTLPALGLLEFHVVGPADGDETGDLLQDGWFARNRFRDFQRGQQPGGDRGRSAGVQLVTQGR